MNSSFLSGARGHLFRSALLLAGLGSQVAAAKVVSYQYYRFHPLKLQGANEVQVQLAEFQFFNGATPIATSGATVTDPTGDNPAAETPDKAFDGSVSTKWLNNHYQVAYLVFDFGGLTTIDRYNYVTGNDTPTRDPVSWIVEGSFDGFTWNLLDNVTDNPANPNRQQTVSATNFVLPDHPVPLIDNFELSNSMDPAIVVNDTEVQLFAAAQYATTAKITNDADSSVIDVPVLGTGDPIPVSPPPNRDTTYTLTASAGGPSVTKSLTLRTVEKQTQNFQYVRYTPVKLRGGGVAPELAGFAFSNAGTPVTATGATGANTTNNHGAEGLIDTSTASYWAATALSPVVINFGAPKAFDSYNFYTTTSGAAVDPVQWILEGSNDQSTWTLIDNVTAFDYPTTTARAAFSGDIPIPGSSSEPFGSLTSNVPLIVQGESATLTYVTAGGTTYSISPGVTTPGPTGQVTVTPQATTIYVLTVTGADNKTVTKSVTLNVVVPSGAVAYSNFENSSDLNLVGSAQILNDFRNFPNAPDAKRLRLTGLNANVNGSAWSLSKMKVKDGFETTFDAQMTYPVYVNGADGIAFTIQNATGKYAAAADSGLAMSGGKSVTIALDTYPDVTGETQANLEVFSGPAPAKKVVNLDANAGATKVAKGYKQFYLVTQPTAAPYHVKISYVPGSLTVTIDGVVVLSNYSINLADAGAVDADGKAWVGFSARTRNIVANQDILNWTLTPGASVATPLTITASSFTFGATPQASLTFTSTSGKTYQVTQSADLVNWTPVGATVTASGPSTTTSVPFTAGAKGFFRVEQTN